ncbi:MAG TPA: NAD(P)/FAD-dependent oxidoreductase, partial [Streptosporangiaceae bacterium]|nr:NAD(P)/FAD-dependent oxidoreductase [Streptosporangiaceae bacterium]
MTSVTDVVVLGGGQSGLAAARTLQAHGISPVVLEAGPEPAGSWPLYYDSLTLFSPARYSSMPGLDFSGEPDHYPHRDEVAAYLRRYAASLGADIRTNTPVTAVQAHGHGRFAVHTATGQTIYAAGVVAATGSFGSPYMPILPGQDRFTGRLLHVVGYRSPHPHAGERVVVVGAGNSAVQVGYELAQVATVTLAIRHPLTFHPQCRGGRDLHHGLVT